MATPPKLHFFRQAAEADQMRYQSELDRERQAAIYQAITTARLAEQRGLNEIAREADIKAIMLANPGMDRAAAEGVYSTQKQAKPAAETAEDIRQRRISEGGTPGADELGRITTAADTANRGLAMDTANLGRKVVSGASPGAEQIGIAKTGADINEQLARASSARLSKLVSDTRVPTAPMAAANKDRAESTEFGNTANYNAAASSSMPALARSAMASQIAGNEAGTAMSQYKLRETGALDPQLAADLQNTSNKLGLSSANLQIENPILNPALRVLPGMGGMPITSQQLQDALKAGAQLRKKTAPNVTANPSTLQTRDLGALD